jgi:hypothetical protein
MLGASLARRSSYTPAMRRWVCVIALLTGFSGQGYVWSARPREPVPVERPVARPTASAGLRLAADWWRRP